MAIPNNYIDKITNKDSGESRIISPAADKVRVDNENFEGTDLDEVLDEVAQAIDEAGSGDGTVTGVKVGNTTYEPTEGVVDLSTPFGGKVDKVTGYGLSKNDYTDADKTAVGTIPSKANDADVVKSISVNGTAQQKNNGNVNISTPTKTSDLVKDDVYTKGQTDAAIQTEVQDAVSDVTVNAISNLEGTMGIAYADGITVFAFGYQAISAPPVITTSETYSQVVVTATGVGTIKLYDNGSEVASGTNSASYTFTKGSSASTHTMTATAKDGNKDVSNAASLEVTVPAINYIANGLVFHLDGEDATNSTWADKIGNKSFALTDCTKNADGSVSFNGTSSKGLCSESPVVGDDWTIEVVYNNTLGTGNQFLFSWQNFRATNYGICYAFWNSQAKIINALYHQSSGSDRNIACAEVDFTPGIKVHSITSGSLRNIQSGVAKGWGQVIGFLLDTESMKMQLGARYYTQSGTSDGSFSGKIYQIRVYNRALTADEINWNQTIDMNKYNIS